MEISIPLIYKHIFFQFVYIVHFFSKDKDHIFHVSIRMNDEACELFLHRLKYINPAEGWPSGLRRRS